MKIKKFKFETTGSILSSGIVIDAELADDSPHARIESEENSEQSLVFAHFEHLHINNYDQLQLSIKVSFERISQMIVKKSRKILRKEVM